MITIIKHEIKRFYKILILGVALVVILSLINFGFLREETFKLYSVLITLCSVLTSLAIFILMVRDLRDSRILLFNQSTLSKRKIIVSRLLVILISYVVVMIFGMMMITIGAKIYYDMNFVIYMMEQIYLIPYVMVDRVWIEYISPFNIVLNVFLFYVFAYYGAIRYLYEAQHRERLNLRIYWWFNTILWLVVYQVLKIGLGYLAEWLPFLNLYERGFWRVVGIDSNWMVNFFFLPGLIVYGLIVKYLIGQSEVLFKHTSYYN